VKPPLAWDRENYEDESGWLNFGIIEVIPPILPCSLLALIENS